MNIIFYVLITGLIETIFIQFWWHELHLIKTFLGFTLLSFISGILLFLIYEWIFQYLDKFKINHIGKNFAVLVTGCDSGFGLLISQKLANMNYHVFATVLDLTSEGSITLQKLSNVTLVQMNVTNEEDIKQAYDKITSDLNTNKRQLWGLINNAGIGHLQLLTFTPIKKIEDLWNINSLGMLKMCQMFIPLLFETKGRIINITSMAGTSPAPFFGGYCISKFAAEAISRILRIELYPLGIHLATVQPYIYKTPITRSQTAYSIEPESAMYGEAFMKESIAKLIKIFDEANPNLNEVTDCLISALFNKYPKDIYIPSRKGRIQYLLRQCLGEWFMTRYGLKNFMGNISSKTI